MIMNILVALTRNRITDRCIRFGALAVWFADYLAFGKILVQSARESTFPLKWIAVGVVIVVLVKTAIRLVRYFLFTFSQFAKTEVGREQALGLDGLWLGLVLATGAVGLTMLMSFLGIMTANHVFFSIGALVVVVFAILMYGKSRWKDFFAHIHQDGVDTAS